MSSTMPKMLKSKNINHQFHIDTCNLDKRTRTMTARSWTRKLVSATRKQKYFFHITMRPCYCLWELGRALKGKLRVMGASGFESSPRIQKSILYTQNSSVCSPSLIPSLLRFY